MAGVQKTAKILLLLNALQDDDDEDEEEFLLTYFMCQDKASQASRQRIKQHYTNTIPLYSTSDFKIHFRIEKTTFEDLLHNIGSALTKDPLVCCPIDPKKQLLVCLWMLGNQESLRLVSERFDVAKGSARNYVFNVCNVLVDWVPQHITWPTGKSAAIVMENFQERAGFPGIMGALGTTHIPILAPHDSPASYICEKGYHSIILQGVCDHKMEFIDCFVGMPGNVPDARVFKISDIYKKISSPENDMLPGDSHLVGNEAYPLFTCIMKPYPDNGQLTQKQKQFNHKLLCSRVVIEHAFGHLKGRFRFLKMVNIMRTDLIPKVILACCVLHNICIKRGDIADEDMDQPDEAIGANSNIGRELSVEGCHKRNKISNAL